MNKIRLNPVPLFSPWAIMLLWLLGAIPSPMLAQGWNPTHSSDQAGRLKPEQIQAILTALEDDVDIEPPLKEVLIPIYREALGDLVAAEAYRDQAEAFSEAIDSAPSTIWAQGGGADEGSTYAKDISGSLEEASIEQLQRDLPLQRVYLSRLDDELASVLIELKRIEARPSAISSRLSMAQAELIQLRSKRAALTQTDYDAAPELTAERTLSEAHESRLVSEIRMLEQEQLSQAVREALLRSEQVLLEQNVENANAGLERIQVLLRHGLTREAMRLNWLRKIPLTVANGDGEGGERDLIEEVRGFADEFEHVVQNLEQADRTRDQLAMDRKALDADFSMIKEELALAGGGIGMTQVLLDLHRRLPEKHRDVRVLMEALPSVDDARLATLRTRAALAKQASIAQRFTDHALPVLASVVDARYDILNELGSQYGNLTHALAELEAERERFLATLERIDDYVSRQLFGFGSRDSSPFAIDNLAQTPEELRWYVQRAHWLEIGDAIVLSAQNAPLLSFVTLLFLGLLAWKRRWLRGSIEHAGHDLRRFSTDRYSRTLEALLWTLLLAAPWPVAISYVNWALQQTLYLSQWGYGMALGLYLTASFTFTLRFLALMCRPGGLAEVHFGWNGHSLLRFRRLANQLLLAYIPSLLLVYGGFYEGGSQYLFNTGCAIFMFCHFLIAVIFWHVVIAEQGFLGELMRDQPDRLFLRWRYLWIPLVVGTPLALAVLAGMGYLITALQTSRSLAFMGTIVAAAIVGYGLAVRWLRIRQRRLAMARRLARDQKPSAMDQELGIEIEGSELDLGTISDQALRLLRVLFTLATAFSVLLYWSEAAPLVGILGTVSLPGFEQLTLADLLWVVLTAVLTYISVRSLPGLMELTILSNMQVQSGTRHAVVTLCQYTLVVIGLSAVFKLLHLDLAMFGWLLAALGVGIGFGLQEIVANFVCGIILLFERPIRVGDRVTIDGVLGTVTHIQLRATIITNFDRQDFVVPNKRLITGSILNWTLSGDLNRIVVPVSVSPGIDMDTARNILFEAAMSHARVLEDPEPIAVFESFSGGLRNFILYAFLPDLQYRLQVISELHTDIEQRFGAAGIEIALPQTQLNLPVDPSRAPSTGTWKKSD